MNQIEHLDKAFEALDAAMNPKPTIVERLQAGAFLCLNCGPVTASWFRRGMHDREEARCDECQKPVITWEQVQDGLGQHVSTDEWRQLQAEYPEVVKAAEEAEAK